MEEAQYAYVVVCDDLGTCYPQLTVVDDDDTLYFNTLEDAEDFIESLNNG